MNEPMDDKASDLESRELEPGDFAPGGESSAEEAPETGRSTPRGPQAGREPLGDGPAGRPEEPQDLLVAASELADLRKKAEERELYRNELLRARADLDNYQKRVRKDRVRWEQHAVGGLIRRLLPVVDDLERALEAAEQEGATLDGLSSGVRLTQQALAKVLEEDGVVEIPALGETFNPEVHEAVMEEPVSDRPTGEVVEVLQKGYTRNDTVLRPTKVKVARNVVS